MSSLVTKRFTQKLIDWLIAFCVSILVLWFVITQPVIDPSKQTNNHAVDTKKLKQHVQLLTGGYAPRTINYDNLNHTADYIYRQFSNVGLPEYQLINTISKQYKNVTLQLGPDTQELYVIGAHYDAEDDSIDSEGNASGVATLIELARQLAENYQQLEIGVILVAYPLSLNQTDNMVNTGSFFHAQSLKKENRKIRLMVSLDSVGQKETDIGNQHPFKFMDYLYPKKDNAINLVGRLKDFSNIRELKKGFNNASPLNLMSHNLPESFNKSHSSDHINYWKQGYPAVLISDYLYADKKMDPDYKSEVDPQDRLDYEKMASLVNGLFQVIVQTQTEEQNRTQLAQRSRNKKSKPLLQ